MGRMRMCDLCAMNGDKVKAIGEYTAEDGIEYDVCKKHAELAKARGFHANQYTATVKPL